MAVEDGALASNAGVKDRLLYLLGKMEVSLALVDEELFRRLLATAAEHAPELEPFMARLGRIEITRSRHASVADQLYMEIVNQQLSAKAADAIWARIEAAALQRGVEPKDLFTVEHKNLVRACGLSANKTRALQAVRAALDAGLLDQVELASLDTEARTQRLLSIWGVGRWTADMVSIFHFLDPDVWPSGDVAVVGTLRRITGHADPEVVALFAPYRSILARYLWRIRDAIAAAPREA